ncbi:hypothetical protein SELMODRAFT_417799 [Selaginella moellendorffii]|uniref:Peptidase S8/S53 domain-containing protein n=1 Tax=Selaginella moellendorffii TaxID=88036 RepID=D8S3N3_SELML|nr:hypothetical protein SELMODRAFT_417799 [Selaginella moellendorffii]
MALSICLYFLLSLSAISISQGRDQGDTHIVYLGNVDKSLHPDAVTSSHHALLGDVLGSVKAARESLGFSYRHGFSGFSARLTEEQAAQLSGLPNVLSVFRNEFHTVHTTDSSEFLGLYGSGEKSLFGASDAIESSWLWKKSKFGKDVIIGVLDSGVWPESESFLDHGMGPIPKRWKGACETGEQLRFSLQQGPRPARGSRGLCKSTPRTSFPKRCSRPWNSRGFYCRRPICEKRKLVWLCERDSRLAIYKICWRNITEGSVRCPDSHVLSAFDMGIHDGVDIISASFGRSAGDYFLDSTSIGAFHAMQKGIVVVASAGNEQQTVGPGSVKNVAPWVITVGASTLDRSYFGDLYLGNNKSFRGLSMTEQRLKKRWYHLAVPTSNFSTRQLCMSQSLEPKKVRGKIVACLRGPMHPAFQSFEVSRAGGAGIIICNSTLVDQNPRKEFLPSVHVDEEVGQAIFSYIKSTRNPVADIQHQISLRNQKPAPFMAPTSSSGPNFIDPDILKFLKIFVLSAGFLKIFVLSAGYYSSRSIHSSSIHSIQQLGKEQASNSLLTLIEIKMKLIGARFFSRGLQDGPEAYAKANQEVLSQRDIVGHGTHVASTAGAQFVRNTNWFDYAKGTAKGGAPDHVLQSTRYAGETSRPAPDGPGSVGNVAPWLITVGASTLDRAYFADLFLGNNESFRVYEAKIVKTEVSSCCECQCWLELSSQANVYERVFGFQRSPGKDCGMLERANASTYAKFLELVELGLLFEAPLKILEMRFFLQFMLMKELDKPSFHISILQVACPEVNSFVKEFDPFYRWSPPPMSSPRQLALTFSLPIPPMSKLVHRK